MMEVATIAALSAARISTRTEIAMLEKPNIQDEKIIDCLRDLYRLHVVNLTFLPLGYADSAVYRAAVADETPYFVKLIRGIFDETSVAVPKFLSDQGIGQVMAPLANQSQQLWTELNEFKLIVYPFVEGHNGFQVDLSDRHWNEFGVALKEIHNVTLPTTLLNRLQRETYSPRRREMVQMFQSRIEQDIFHDPIAAKLAAFLKTQRDEVRFLVERADRLASALETRVPEYVLCHSDIHAGNILIDAHGSLYIVDWDNPILAPKERDLMFVGGGVGGIWCSTQEEALFYSGYGQTEIDPIALAYYRYERIVEDIAVFCEQILLTDKGSEDRENGVRKLASAFLPNNVIEIARRSENILPAELSFRAT
jgi:spectinomycin phosphotransferase